MKLTKTHRAALSAALAFAMAGTSLGVHAQDAAASSAVAPQTTTQPASAATSASATPTEPVPTVPAAPASTAAAPPPATPAIAQLNSITPPPPGKGQVVFFRPSRYVGAFVSFSVREGDTGIVKLTNGSYFVWVTDPGVKEYNISFEARDTLRMEVEEGETYYVNESIAMGIVGARPNLTPSTEEDFQAKQLKLTTAKATDRH